MEYNTFWGAADVHNFAKDDRSWFDKKIDATGNLVGDLADALLYGSQGAIVSGVQSIANSAISLGNWAGKTSGLADGKITQYDTYKTLKEYDSDVAKYYRENQAGVDLAGFAVTAFAPGMTGIKAFKAAEAGFMGSNFARATGIYEVASSELAVARATASIIEGKTVVSLANKEVLKGLGLGFGREFLEATAFETAVAGTMFANPVLSDMSLGDLGINILTGGAIGGTLGGIFSGVQFWRGLNKTQAGVAKETFPFQVGEELGPNASSDLRIINWAARRSELENFKFEGPVTPEREAYVRRQEATRQESLRALDNKISAEFQVMAKGDAELANLMSAAFKSSVASKEDAVRALLHTKNIGRISASESADLSELLVLNHKLNEDAFKLMQGGGDLSNLLVAGGRNNAESVYKIVGKSSDAYLASAGDVAEDGVSIFTKAEDAFAAGVDVFRNKNGSYSVNPESKIIQKAPSIEARRDTAKIIIDLKNGGQIVTKASQGLADLGSVTISGNTVVAGKQAFAVNVADTAFNFGKRGLSLAEVEARRAWFLAQETAGHPKAIKWEGKVVHENDLAALEKAWIDGAKGFKIKQESGHTFNAPEGNMLRNFVAERKANLVKQLDGLPMDDLERRLNIKEDFIVKADINGWIEATKKEDVVLPRYAVLDFGDKNAIATMQQNEVEGLLHYQHRVQTAQDSANIAVAAYAKELDSLAPAPINLRDPTRTPTGTTAGSTFLGFANAAYGSIQAWAQSVGNFTDTLKRRAQTAAAEKFNLSFTEIAANRVKAVELATVNNELRKTAEAMIFNPIAKEGEKAYNELMPARLIRAATKKDGTVDLVALSKSYDEYKAAGGKLINVADNDVAEALRTHADLNYKRQVHINNLKANAGMSTHNQDYPIVYPVGVNTQKYPHFLYVRNIVDDSVAFLVAKDVNKLRELKGLVDTEKHAIYTKDQLADYFKGKGTYEYELGFNERLVDHELSRNGKLSEFFPRVEPDQVVADFFDFHMKQEEILATKMVSTKYGQVFEELEQLGKTEISLAESQFGKVSKNSTRAVPNPYADIEKTALGISKSNEYPWWSSFNKLVQQSIEGPVNVLSEFRRNMKLTKEIDDKFIDDVARVNKEYGIEPAFKGTMEALVSAGNIAPQPWLPKFIAKTHAVLSTAILQTDFFNAVNTYLGAPILMSAEMRYLRQGIEKADPEIAGKLAQLLSSKVPGEQLSIPSTTRLIAEALAEYTSRSSASVARLERYNRIGTVTDFVNQERKTFDNLSMDWNNVKQGEAESRLDKFIEGARTWTGNRRAEETTRYVASYVMDRVSELAVQAGIMSAKEADEYIQLFVNKVQGNYLAAQRPIVFQGVVGQAIGLFQTYQLNLLQQMLKYVGDGDKKSIATLLGLQGSIYGLQGMPAFNFLNTHIVGNASGNTEHKDLYTASYTVAGKELGNWLLYGAGSNALGIIDPALRFNLYSRGDINPRQLTVLPNPTNPEEIPMIGATISVVKNLFNVAQKIGDGGAVWQTFADGIAHNGISRPLAGLGMVMAGNVTTSKGNLLASGQDLNAIAKAGLVLGAKPMELAIAMDDIYRINAYKAKNRAEIEQLGEAVKSQIYAGGSPTPEQNNTFMAEFSKIGRQEQFQQFMTNAYKNATESQIQKMRENVQFGERLQLIMGGTRPQVFPE